MILHRRPLYCPNHAWVQDPDLAPYHDPYHAPSRA
ncbi:hypothetical protein PMI40_04202 [Herbaspirillum sp. YR522]|nr:hypothetical protein PMI40_04202 [Herbaspirillum sp. YR522]